MVWLRGREAEERERWWKTQGIRDKYGIQIETEREAGSETEKEGREIDGMKEKRGRERTMGKRKREPESKSERARARERPRTSTACFHREMTPGHPEASGLSGCLRKPCTHLMTPAWLGPTGLFYPGLRTENDNGLVNYCSHTLRQSNTSLLYPEGDRLGGRGVFGKVR